MKKYLVIVATLGLLVNIFMINKGLCFSEDIDNETIQRIRVEVSESSTNPKNLFERHRVLMEWIGQLLAQGVDVDKALPRSAAVELAQLVRTRKFNEACPRVDVTFRKLEEICAETINQSLPKRVSIQGPGPVNPARNPKLVEAKPPTFFMVHFEVGGDNAVRRGVALFRDIIGDSNFSNKDLRYQAVMWPTAIKIVELANKYGFKLTLALNPQWAEYILKDDKKIKIVREWQGQGHELAFHHHGINHIDWNGYSNRPEAAGDPRYRGTASEGFAFVKKLAAPNKVVTGCITDTKSDKPDDIVILTRGSRDIEKDIMGEPYEMYIGEGTKLTWVNHAYLEKYLRNDSNFARTKKLKNRFKKLYDKAQPNIVVGVVSHCHDFYRHPDFFRDWFEFVKSRGNTIRTVSEIVKITKK